MLDEYKQIYESRASLISDWQNMSKSELAIKYVQTQDDAYMSALMCKYWYLIGSYYFRQGIKQASETDCYDWLVEGITYALDNHDWDKPTNKLYGDPKGPEKAIMVCIGSARANFYQYIKHHNRVLNYTSSSIDEIQEKCSDGFLLGYEQHHDNFLYDVIHHYVKEKFSSYDYFLAIILDLMLNTNYKEEDPVHNDASKICRAVNKLDSAYINYFSSEYNISEKEVTDAVNLIKGIKIKDIKYIQQVIRQELFKLKECL